MFLIWGIDQKQKELGGKNSVICGNCGSYQSCQVFMTYMCLSIFFIPILKWGRKYIVRMNCCQSLYALDKEVGKRLARGEEVSIEASDLTLLQQGRNTWGSNTWENTGEYTKAGQDSQGEEGETTDYGRRCLKCGYETMEDFAFCPRCGEQLRYKVK